MENARRWGAVWTFRLASGIQRCAMTQIRRGRISRNGLLTVLSGTRWLERFGAWLALGHRRRKRQQIEKDFQGERFD
jgi:hypothetical protein